MAKKLYGYTLGANIEEKEAAKSVKLVPDNKTLIVMPFNDEPDDEVDPVRLMNMKQIFEHYQPERDLEFKNLEGEADEYKIQFENLRDFSRDGIVDKSPVLQELEEQEELYARFVDIFQTNEKLQTVLNNEDSKKEFVELIETLLAELE